MKKYIQQLYMDCSLEVSFFFVIAASILQLVSVFGAVFSGFVVEHLGPRRLILIFLPLLSASCFALIAASNNSHLLIFVRAIQVVFVFHNNALNFVKICPIVIEYFIARVPTKLLCMKLNKKAPMFHYKYGHVGSPY